MERRLRFIKSNQCLHIFLHLTMRFLFQKLPIQRFIFCPLMHLSKFLSHKQQLFTWMNGHESIGSPEICHGLLRCSRHFLQQRTFTVNHFIVRQAQKKLLTVGINHGECQFSVMLPPIERIVLHIADKVIHPAHIPLIIKAQAVLLYISRNLRPSCRLLSDEHHIRIHLLEHGI